MRRTAWRRAAAIVVLVVVAVALVGVIDTARLWRGIDRADVALPGAGGGAVNYLLVGSDSRSFVEGSADTDSFGSSTGVPGARADMIMVLHIPAAGAPVLLSVPRDLVVEFPNLGEHRVTLALTKGPQLLVDTLCTSLGIGIDHVAILNFDGFRKVVDLVGGVDVAIEAPMRDVMTGLNLPGAGTVHLDGAQALALVRSRHAEHLVADEWQPMADGAGQRVTEAQSVMRALGPEVSASSSSLWGKRRLLASMSGAVTVDSSMGRDDVDTVAASLRQVSSQSEAMRQIPVQTLDGPVPSARALPGSDEVLRSVGAGTNPRCRARPLVAPGPLPTEPPGPDTPSPTLPGATDPVRVDPASPKPS